jgi:hypothetical protein
VRLDVLDAASGTELRLWAFPRLHRFHRPHLRVDSTGIAYPARIAGWSIPWPKVTRITLHTYYGSRATLLVYPSGSAFDIPGPNNPVSVQLALWPREARKLHHALAMVAARYAPRIPIETV